MDGGCGRSMIVDPIRKGTWSALLNAFSLWSQVVLQCEFIICVSMRNLNFIFTSKEQTFHLPSSATASAFCPQAATYETIWICAHRRVVDGLRHETSAWWTASSNGCHFKSPQRNYTRGWTHKGLLHQMGRESAAVPSTRPCSWS